MPSTNFSAGTVIASSWLNEVNTAVHKKLPKYVNVLDYGAVGDGVTNDTAAFQAAAAAAQGGYVDIPAGTFRINRVGAQGVVFRGRGPNATILKAFSSGTGYLIDCALNTDGTTVNTDGRQGGACNLMIDGNSMGYHGIRTYGGFSVLHDLFVTNCVDGVTMGLPIEMLVYQVYSYSNTGRGFYTYSGAGDLATSLTCIGCWGNLNGSHNWHLTQLTYSTFISCGSQECLSTAKGWFVEGATNGSGVGSSLSFISCGSEGDNGEPFYFKNQRGVVVVTPKIVEPPTNKNLVVFDNASGTLDAFQSPTPGVGYYGVSIVNYADSNGGIVIKGGSTTLNTTEVPFVTNLGSEINGRRFFQIAGSLRGSIQSPTILSGATINDYAFTVGTGILRLNPAVGGTSITGLAGGVDGMELIIHNLSTADNLTLVHGSVSSAAANRWNLGGATNKVIPPLGCALVWYDGTVSRWKSI